MLQIKVLLISNEQRTLSHQKALCLPDVIGFLNKRLLSHLEHIILSELTFQWLAPLKL